MGDLKILNVIEHADRVAIEYEMVEPIVDGYQPHHPQTFPALASDDTCTWDNLRLLLAPQASREECIALAAALLAKHLEEEEIKAQHPSNVLELVRAVLQPEVK